MPESGHRYGDIVLHDGGPVGTRRLGDHELGVFNEIALWSWSPHATLTAPLTAPGPGPDDVQDLIDRCEQAGGGAEDWTTSVRLLCLQCSEGNPQDEHQHAPPTGTWEPRRSVGLAGTPDQLERALITWSAAGAGRDHTDVDLAVPPPRRDTAVDTAIRTSVVPDLVRAGGRGTARTAAPARSRTRS